MLEHLSSNSKSIKELLCWITKHIKNKNIEYNKANNILDLSSIGKAVWNFISTIYELDWNSLVTDKENKTLKQQVVSKFTPKIQKTRTTSKSDKLTDKPASFMKLTPPISIKTSKEVMEIFKFFKKGIKLTEKKDTRKLYVQALSPKTSKILKIKKKFPKL